MLKFLSTPSARRATHHSAGQSNRHGNFYPRPPRGGRPWLFLARGGSRRISIHALREEGDKNPRVEIEIEEMISIHALRVEGDSAAGAHRGGNVRFLSTPSARRATGRDLNAPLILHQFLSTPSARRATWKAISGASKYLYFYPRPPRGGRLALPAALRNHLMISIHALREEGDFVECIIKDEHTNFYPRPPRGGRLQKQRQNLYFLINYTTFCTNLEEL